MKNISRKKLLKLAWVVIPAAIFYLFVVPALVATEIIPPSECGIAFILFAAFLYFQLWMLTAELAYSSAAELYNFRKKELWSFYPKSFEHKDGKRKTSASGVAIFSGLSYLFTLYGFAIAYTYLSHVDIKAFNIGKLSLFESIYFSVVTAATVGYGDIIPISTSARLLVVAEIFVNLVYVIFIFSVIANGIQNNKSDRSVVMQDLSNNNINPKGSENVNSSSSLGDAPE
jgi:voltage-gated potassium channel